MYLLTFLIMFKCLIQTLGNLKNVLRIEKKRERRGRNKSHLIKLNNTL